MTRRKTGLTRRNPAEFGTVEERGGRYRALYRVKGAVIRAPRRSTLVSRPEPGWPSRNARCAAVRGSIPGWVPRQSPDSLRTGWRVGPTLPGSRRTRGR